MATKMKELTEDLFGDSDSCSQNVLEVSKLILNESNNQRKELFQLKRHIDQLVSQVESFHTAFVEKSNKYEQ